MSASNVVQMPESAARLTPARLAELALEHLIDARIALALAGRAPKPSTRPTPEELRVASKTLNGAVWTPELLAGRLKTCASTVVNIESGKSLAKHQRTQTWAMVDRMAAVLGISQTEYRESVLRARSAWLVAGRK